MGVGRFISIPAFIISFAIGVFVVYLSEAKQRVIHVYPTPENEKRILYKDKADQCFEFRHQVMNCPSDKTQIKEIPIQSP
jgi:hypothetical protein